SSGINSNSNGIILRNDLHTLFDNNLLVIHPITLLVKIHSKLRKSDYWKFDGTRVSNRSDRSNINKKYLEERWASAEWVNKKRPA
ncbi:MAG: HNH endonuclease, partial [Heyndrickxia sp.]